MSQLFLRCIVGLLILLPNIVLATASGPDYWQTINKSAYLFDKADTEGSLIADIPPQSPGLKNLGCQGGLDFSDWQAATHDQRDLANENRWCHVEFEGLHGWVQAKYLKEDPKTKPPLLSPSFDCKEVQSRVEKLICSDDELITLDLMLDKIYQQALTIAHEQDVSPHKNYFKAYQRGWIKGRNDCWKATTGMKACVKHSYEHRISELQAQWTLVDEKSHFKLHCSDDQNMMFTLYETSFIPAGILSVADEKWTLLATKNTSSKEFVGDFGRYIQITGNQASVMLDQYVPVKSCTAQRSDL